MFISMSLNDYMSSGLLHSLNGDVVKIDHGVILFAAILLYINKQRVSLSVRKFNVIQSLIIKIMSLFDQCD